MNPLEQLPVKKIWARKTGGGMVPVLVDGDYDGEYFEAFRWRVMPHGYVYTNTPEYSYDEKIGGWKSISRNIPGNQNVAYLHHFVLPPKRGFWVCHINGDKLDNRSVNLKYLTPKEAVRIREEHKWETLQRKYYEKMASLRGGSNG